MKMKHCKLSNYKQCQLKKLFLANVSARKAAEIVKVNRSEMGDEKFGISKSDREMTGEFYKKK